MQEWRGIDIKRKQRDRTKVREKWIEVKEWKGKERKERKERNKKQMN